jgi:hypothetical protein
MVNSISCRTCKQPVCAMVRNQHAHIPGFRASLAPYHPTTRRNDKKFYTDMLHVSTPVSSVPITPVCDSVTSDKCRYQFGLESLLELVQSAASHCVLSAIAAQRLIYISISTPVILNITEMHYFVPHDQVKLDMLQGPRIPTPVVRLCG